MKPEIPITDSRFVYTDAANTDIRKKFARIRREMADMAKAAAEQRLRERIVTNINRRKA